MALIVFILNCVLLAIVHGYWASFTTGYNTGDVTNTLYKTVLNELTLDGVAGQQQSGYGVIEMCFAYDSNLHGCKDSCCSSRFDNSQYRFVGIRSYVEGGYGMVDFAAIYQLRTDTSSSIIYANRATNNNNGIHISNTLCENGDEVQQMQIHEQSGYGTLGVAVYCIPVTTAPTSIPTTTPTTQQPTFIPTTQPTFIPTQIPTLYPSKIPTKFPTVSPSKLPSKMPTNTPTISPTNIPTNAPTLMPVVNGEVQNDISTTTNGEDDEQFNENGDTFWSEKMDFIIFVLVILILNVLCCFIYYLWRQKRYTKQIEMVNKEFELHGVSEKNLITEIEENETHAITVTNTQKTEGENNESGDALRFDNNTKDMSSSSNESDDLFEAGNKTTTAGNNDMNKQQLDANV